MLAGGMQRETGRFFAGQLPVLYTTNVIAERNGQIYFYWHRRDPDIRHFWHPRIDLERLLSLVIKQQNRKARKI